MYYLFRGRDSLENRLRNKFLFIFLDYDGTLAPITKAPNKASISWATKSLLRKLSQNPQCKLAIISGRALRDVKKRAGLKNIIYIGNHGLEIDSPQLKFSSPVSLIYKQALKRIKEELNKKTSSIKGVLVEDKGLSLSLHFRLVHANKRALVKAIFHEVVLSDKIKGIIKIKPGKMVLEVRPMVNWDKGKVAVWLLARQQFASAGKQVLPVYIGDDLTDEDAFRALKNKGITILVGQAKASHAQYYLKDINEVVEFLRIISKLRNM